MARRLAFLLPDMKGGGAERVALRLMEAFAGAGEEVDLLLMAPEGELMPLVPPAVRIVDLKAPRIRNALPAIMRYLKTEQPEAIQVSMWPLTAIAILAHRLARSRARLVVSDHTILSLQYRSFGRAVMTALKLTARLLYPLADARVGVSEAVVEDLSRLSRMPRERFDVIYNPLSPPQPASAEERAAAERIWGGDGARILSVGSIKSEKNYPLLIRAFARLLESRPARLVILGEGPLRYELEEAIRTAGVGDHVVLAGFAVHPAAWYESADLFVLSSDFEGFGNVLVEAMRAGLPVVSTDCGGPREILDSGRFGRLVPVGDAEALAAAIEAALDGQADVASHGERALVISGSDSVRRYRELMVGGSS